MVRIRIPARRIALAARKLVAALTLSCAKSPPGRVLDATRRAPRRSSGAWWARAGIAVFSVLSSVHVAGCSLIGYTVGSVIDARSSNKTRLVPTGEIRLFHPGDPLVLHLRDSTMVAGVYSASGRESPDSYRTRYEAWRATHPEAAGMPALDESVRLQAHGYTLSWAGNGRFAGFTHRGVLLQGGAGEESVVPFDAIRRLEPVEGRGIPGKDLLRLRRSDVLPLLTVLEVATPGGVREVALDSVAYLKAPAEKNAAHTGLVIGLTADALIVVTVFAMAASFQGPFDNGSGCSSSSAVLLGPDGIPDALYRRALAAASTTGAVTGRSAVADTAALVARAAP